MEKKRRMKNMRAFIEAVRIINKRENRMIRIVNSRLDLVEEECQKLEKRKMEEKYKKVVELADQVTEEIEEFLKPVVETVEEMEKALRKVNDPPSLAYLVACTVAEKELEVKGLPTTLQTRVEGLPTEGVGKAAHEAAHLACARVQGIKMGTRMIELQTKVIETISQISGILEANFG